jgi:hypothetical protein
MASGSSWRTTLVRVARLSLSGQSLVSFCKKLQVKARRHVPLAAGLSPDFRSLLTIAVFVRHIPIMPFYILQPSPDPAGFGDA